MDAILRFAGKETAAVLEHDDFFVAIHLVYLAFQDRQRSLQVQQQKITKQTVSSIKQGKRNQAKIS